jgi:very-short-patch-repair endonuclease
VGDNAISRSRALRKALTEHEARLSVRLRKLRSQGCHFRRQAPFRGYFLDFVCLGHKVVVELDGGGHGHDAQAEHDRRRDAVLSRDGFRVLRFWNYELDDDIDAVMEAIWRALGEAAPPPVSPAAIHPPREGEGRIVFAPQSLDGPSAASRVS